MRSNIIIISGQKNTGKSTLCAEIVRAGKKAGLDVAGILSPTAVHEGIRTRIDAQDIRTGISKPLAYTQAFTTEGPVTERWHFDNQTFLWGNERLCQALPCDILVIDEIGPLELKQGKGWIAGLGALEKSDYRAAFVVVRLELIDEVVNRWPVSRVINVSEGNRYWNVIVWRLRVSLMKIIPWL